jgi:hypothetical protein
MSAHIPSIGFSNLRLGELGRRWFSRGGGTDGHAWNVKFNGIFRGSSVEENEAEQSGRELGWEFHIVWVNSVEKRPE